MDDEVIRIRGARQNNLKDLTLELPLGKLIVLTGPSGSGKSSLAFDTIYAEGQRRYVETFSAYTRQFLDRMDRPRVDGIDGIPPAIAIDQTNPVRTSRSTVGTMTELSDHLKLLWARASTLHCSSCGKPVRRDGAESIRAALEEREGGSRVLVTFPVIVPESYPQAEALEALARLGYHRILERRGTVMTVIQDRIAVTPANRSRLVEDLEAALKYGHGRVDVHTLGSDDEPVVKHRFSSDLHCPDCDIHYRDALPNLFSFNSPMGACDTCRGFGRTIGIDYGLVVPDESRTLKGGAVRVWQTASYLECQQELLSFGRKRGIRLTVPWRELTEEERSWVLEGEGSWDDGKWYGVRRFFEWLETKSYKMHIRVLLSKYRAYRPCPVCRGARLKPEALNWKIEGRSIHDVVLLPVDRCRELFDTLRLPAPLDEAAEVLLKEIRTRLGYLVDVGLGYLALDRQSRTLSGGEVQRINLTTALGTSLVNTLFVLDEPSVGLHARDIGRLITVLKSLRDAGNTLLVVEHDPDVIRAADLVVDMGPGAGENGGRIIFQGTVASLLSPGRRGLTSRYLRGDLRVAPTAGPRKRRAGGEPPDRVLSITGAGEHNLKDVTLRLPLGRLVCITGVSGSGKSTLIQDVLYNALRKAKGLPAETPGKHGTLEGAELIRDVVLVDQSPIGKTARSNPASYVGAFNTIRELFAREPLARERRYTAATFSFNTGSGRCPTCGGNGFERVEMQFLSDVYIRCPDCDGKRYRPEVLEVLHEIPGTPGAGKSVADVLAMTVTEACEHFASFPQVVTALRPLAAVGLGYLRLGQPVPTLSGGEAQRLKLAGYLAPGAEPGGAAEGRGPGLLFLFDEPTTGLHFDDIATLLAALRELVAAGHSVAVIEHNLDVIAAADWIVDLGPEGGEQGGRILYEGTPGGVLRAKGSHTGRELGRHLRELEEAAGGADGKAPGKVAEKRAVYRSRTARRAHEIRIHNAREHNLQGIDLAIPRDRLTVITGVSGSGKSTVAFDILFAEGQRRYLESLNAYARQFVEPATRPEVDKITGVPPTVAIEQRTSRGGRKSTVATVTEIYHFLRLMFVRLGIQYCPACQVPIQPQSMESILARIMREHRGKKVRILAPLVTARKGYYTDLAAWAAGKGYAELRVDGKMVSTRSWPRLDRYKEHDIELPLPPITVSAAHERELEASLTTALAHGKGSLSVVPAARDQAPAVVFSTRRACPRCSRSFAELDPRLFSYNSRHGWCPSCFGTGLDIAGFDEEQTGEETIWNDWWSGEERPCGVCGGRRLRPEALAVRFQDKTIAEYTARTVRELAVSLRAMKLAGREAAVARDVLTELDTRLAFLSRVGLGYLTLDRSAPTLSGGEAQRIRLASQLGSNLRGVCYVLDEPTIGLHARDNDMLLDALFELKDKGNTVVVVEHDEATIRRAEHVVDLGPGGGVNGGRVVDEGTLEHLLESPTSLTGRMLRDPPRHPESGQRRSPRDWLRVRGASLHNLKGMDVEIPLGCLVAVTGVSGSGKSTLVRDVLHDGLKGLMARPNPRRGAVPFRPRGCKAIEGWAGLRRLLEVDQAPIGKTPRSCPATYVGFWDDIRKLYAQHPESKLRGWGPSRFSFNVAGGRCEECGGQGMKRIEMSFLPDVTVVCERCGGARFGPETLEVRHRDKTVADLLGMSVEEAAPFFEAHPSIHRGLELLDEVGLGYLRLGQQSPTLSGGEAQRIKLVTELARGGGSQGSLYVLDEPTIGLHMSDVQKLVRVLHRLVGAGNTLVLIEHNLDVIAEADWVIDMGPEGGEGGGEVVAVGPPEAVARAGNRSATARFLKPFLARL